MSVWKPRHFTNVLIAMMCWAVYPHVNAQNTYESTDETGTDASEVTTPYFGYDYLTNSRGPPIYIAHLTTDVASNTYFGSSASVDFAAHTINSRDDSILESYTLVVDNTDLVDLVVRKFEINYNPYSSNRFQIGLYIRRWKYGLNT